MAELSWGFFLPS